MPNLFDLKKDRAFALKKAESILAAAENAGRQLTEAEEQEYSTAMTAAEALTPQIAKIERKSTLRRQFPNGMVIPGGPKAVGRVREEDGPLVFSDDYHQSFFDWLSSGGQNVSAAMYEGSNPAGGYAVPVQVEGQVVPLAPPDRGVREIATVIPTSMDLKIPRATTISTSAIKPEGTGSGSNLFTESEPVLDQFTLSAFMAGLQHQASWELLQDVPAFNEFLIKDALLAQSILEESLFVTGTGIGQAQGLIGNTGAGVTCATHAYSDILDSTFDVMGTLKTPYHDNASWVMSRATSIGLRKAQKQANLYEPVFVREGGKDFLHGYPVTYSASMPAVAAAVTPILFGDFKQGYVIGDRGGSGINVKILDQPKATEGLLVLLIYRRFDGRVRRSEAIQALSTT